MWILSAGWRSPQGRAAGAWLKSGQAGADNDEVEVSQRAPAGSRADGLRADQPAEINNSVTGVIVSYIRDVHGPDVLEEVLQRAGEKRSPEELQDATRWSSDAEVKCLTEMALAVTGDDQLPRRAGERLFTDYSASEVIAMLRSLGDVATVLQLVADAAGKQTTLATFRCLGVDGCVGRVAFRMHDDGLARATTCQYTMGVLSAVPTIFGMAPAAVVEEACQLRGDDSCIVRVEWDPKTADDPEVLAAYVEERVRAQTHRFEALEEMAGRLAQVTDVNEALDVITEQAGMAVRAPRYLLAARLPNDRRLRVHSVGLSDEEAARLADVIVQGAAEDHGGSRLVVDVASGGRRFGRLAAFFPSGHRFLAEERRLLAAYAGHAAAALAQAAALAEARERTDTLTTLLDLARFLGEVRSLEEVAEHVADAALALTHAARAAVLVWEPEDGLLIRRGMADAERPGSRVARTLPPSVALSPAQARELAAEQGAVPLDDSGRAEVGAVASATGLADGALVPMVVGGELLGIIVVGAPNADGAADSSEGPGGPGAVTRLVGLAGLASTALSNASLLDRIRHQAEHDPLTGLPNLRLVDRLAAVGLAEARRRGTSAAVLFVDLDHFKPVNDRLGHAAGDQLLVEAADRLRTAVRGADTVGRVGGDEFVVVLSQIGHLTGAQAVAERVVRCFDEPFAIDGATVRIGASVGVAMSDENDASLAGPLARADAAMYRAKKEGRGRVGLDHGGVVLPARHQASVPVPAPAPDRG